MRYTEQLKCSWSYGWGIFREIWDMFTLHNWHWLIGGLMVVLCVVPGIIIMFTPSQAIYYATTPVPAFAPSLSQELAITDYCWKVGRDPLFFWAFNYFLTTSDGLNFLGNILCVVFAGLLLVAYLREK